MDTVEGDSRDMSRAREHLRHPTTIFGKLISTASAATVEELRSVV